MKMDKKVAIEYVAERFEAGYSRQEVLQELASYNWSNKNANKALAAYDEAVNAGTVTPPNVQSSSTGSEFGEFCGKAFYGIWQVVAWVFSAITSIVLVWIGVQYITKLENKLFDRE